MKVRDIIKQLQNEGWFLARQSGSHKIYKHNSKPGVRIVLPDHGGRKQDGNNELILNYAVFSSF